MTASATASPDTHKNEQSSISKQTVKKGGHIAEEPITVKKAEKQQPVTSLSKKEDRTTQPPKTSENKADPPKQAETKVGVSKPEEKDKIFEVAETKKEMPKDAAVKANNQTEELSKADEKHNSPEKVQVEQDVSKAVEKPEPTPKKASDAIFEAFMNPGSEKVISPQANGNHTEEGKTDGVSATVEADKASIQPRTQSETNNVTNGLQTALPAQNEEEQGEQEEW